MSQLTKQKVRIIELQRPEVTVRHKRIMTVLLSAKIQLKVLESLTLNRQRNHVTQPDQCGLLGGLEVGGG